MEITVDNLKEATGSLLQREEVLKWSPETFGEFFKFTDLFFVGGKVTITWESAKAAEMYEDASPFVHEMMVRIDRRPVDEDEWKRITRSQFLMRFNTIVRVVKFTVQKFPDILGPLMVQQQRRKPQFAWMDEVYDDNGRMKKEEKPMVVEEVPQEKGLAVLEPMAPAQRLQDALGKVADVYYAIASSITQEDIDSLPAKEKINALNKLAYVQANLKAKGGVKVNFNFNKVDKHSNIEDIEAAALEVTDDE